MHGLLRRKLEERAAAGAPVRVALVGAGRFGTSVAAQLSQIEALRLVAVADPNAAHGAAALQAAGWKHEQWRRADSPAAAARLAEAGQAVLTPDAESLERIPIDVLVEATGSPENGARNALRAIRNGSHVVMVTVEADVTCGWALAREARRQGVVYSLTAGDQPGCTMELHDWAVTLGLRVVALGRGTLRYPFDRAGVPEEAFARYGFSRNLVERRDLNPRMYNSFRDGTKAQIEMCALANMTGLPPDKRGMHEPSASLDDLPRLFAARTQGGLLEQEGVVDLANALASDGVSVLDSNIQHGVWAVVTSDQPLVREDMAFYGLHVDAAENRGALYRPYHLCGLETPGTIAQAALLGAATGAPRETPTAEVVAVAKRDLRAGDTLDGSGGRNVYGLIDRAEALARDGLLPLGLAYGLTLKRGVTAGAPISADAVDVPAESLIARLRSEVGKALPAHESPWRGA